MGNLLEIAKSTTDHKVNDSVDLLNIDLSASVQRKLQMNCEIENDELTTVRKKRGRPKKSIAPLTCKWILSLWVLNFDYSAADLCSNFHFVFLSNFSKSRTNKLGHFRY